MFTITSYFNYFDNMYLLLLFNIIKSKILTTDGNNTKITLFII